MATHFYFFRGPRNCGKSLMAELFARHRSDARLYLGTLWSAPEFEWSLAMHRARRQQGWINVESSGDVALDVSVITERLVGFMNSTVVVDGLTTWAFHAAGADGDLLEAGRRIVMELEAYGALDQAGVVCLIDVVPSSFLSPAEASLRAGCAFLSHHVRRRLRPTVVEWEAR